MTQDELQRRQEEHAKWDPKSFQVEPVEGKRRFQDLDLPSELMHAIADLGFQYCTPIQALSLDVALAGKNVAGRAQTGTGKTAAYLVSILTRYLRTPDKRPSSGGCPRSLILAPTRELVIQIAKDAGMLGKYTGLRCLAIYGGMDYDRQRDEVTSAPVDLLVATPGRLLDFIHSHVIDLGHVDTLVIDEADRMLDMGFIPDVSKIIRRLPNKSARATMLYSATLSDNIMKLASQWMEEPVKCECEGDTVNPNAIKQVVYVVTANQKFKILYNHIQAYPDSRTLIFCNRRHTTEDVAEGLRSRGIRCEMLSGDVSQNQRLRVLEDFREGKTRIVVATDVAGRGLHVDDIGFVINFDFPYEPEDYVHRIGRTGRAGQTGIAISFADEDESFIIPDIEKFIGEELKCTMLQPEDPLLAPLPDRRRGNRRDRSESARGTSTETASAAIPKPPATAKPSHAASDEADAPVADAAPASAAPATPEADPVSVSESEAPAPAAETSAPTSAASVSEQEAAPATPTPVEASAPTSVAPDGPATASVSAEPVVAVEAAAPAAPEVVASPETPRAPFIRPRNEPFKPETEAAEAPAADSDSKAETTDEEKPQETVRKEPLPPLCKPVFDKPWLMRDGPTPFRGVPRQKRTLNRAKVLEEWTPGQSVPKPDTPKKEE
ncbi:MAG: DEAD/DEAH box helicase [Kiritimatiellae bacterium]|nr:DEAD/DEAH box helicase [Kiritimatiellia bacterium]